MNQNIISSFAPRRIQRPPSLVFHLPPQDHLSLEPDYLFIPGTTCQVSSFLTFPSLASSRCQQLNPPESMPRSLATTAAPFPDVLSSSKALRFSSPSFFVCYVPCPRPPFDWERINRISTATAEVKITNDSLFALCNMRNFIINHDNNL
jgi:hypothetical protein